MAKFSQSTSAALSYPRKFAPQSRVDALAIEPEVRERFCDGKAVAGLLDAYRLPRWMTKLVTKRECARNKKNAPAVCLGPS